MKHQQILANHTITIIFYLILMLTWCFTKPIFAYEPVLISKISFNESVDHSINTGDIIALNGDYTYLPFKTGIKVINTKDKAKPFEEVGLPGGYDTKNLKIWTYGLTAHEGYLYALDNKYQLVIFDLAMPNIPRWLSEVKLVKGDTNGYRPDRVRILGNTAYASTSKGVACYDIENKLAPVGIDAVIWTNKTSRGMDIFDNYIYYIDSKKQELQLLYKKTEPNNLDEFSHSLFSSTPLSPKSNQVITDKNLAHIAAKNLYQIMSWEDLKKPKIIANYKYSIDDQDNTTIQSIAANGMHSFVGITGSKEITGIAIYSTSKYKGDYHSELIKKYAPDFMDPYHFEMVAAGDYLHIATFNKNIGEYQIIKLAGLDKIALTPRNRIVRKASNLQFTAIGEYSHLNLNMEPRNITDSVAWSTSDPKVATIDLKGIASTRKTGIVDIIATKQDDSKEITSKTSLIIIDDDNMDGVGINDKDMELALPILLDIAAHDDASEKDLYSMYEILATSKKLNPKNEAIKRIILDAMLKNKNLKNRIFRMEVAILLEKTRTSIKPSNEEIEQNIAAKPPKKPKIATRFSSSQDDAMQLLGGWSSEDE